MKIEFWSAYRVSTKGIICAWENLSTTSVAAISEAKVTNQLRLYYYALCIVYYLLTNNCFCMSPEDFMDKRLLKKLEKVFLYEQKCKYSSNTLCPCGNKDNWEELCEWCLYYIHQYEICIWFVISFFLETFVISDVIEN